MIGTAGSIYFKPYFDGNDFNPLRHVGADRLMHIAPASDRIINELVILLRILLFSHSRIMAG